MLCKRADAFKAANLDYGKNRAEFSEDMIKKQRLFMENMLN